MSKQNVFVSIHKVNGRERERRGGKKGAMWGDECVAKKIAHQQQSSTG